MVEVNNISEQFKALYDENADSVYRMCWFKTSDHEVALDLSQDIFTSVWGYLEKGKEVRNLRAFLFTVARNRIKDYYKKKKTYSMSQIGIDDESQIVTADHSSDESAEINELFELLRGLPADHAELLQLRYVEGLSIEEMAVIYNERPNTISVRIYRILKKVRKNL